MGCFLDTVYNFIDFNYKINDCHALCRMISKICVVNIPLPCWWSILIKVCINHSVEFPSLRYQSFYYTKQEYNSVCIHPSRLM